MRIREKWPGEETPLSSSILSFTLNSPLRVRAVQHVRQKSIKPLNIECWMDNVEIPPCLKDLGLLKLVITVLHIKLISVRGASLFHQCQSLEIAYMMKKHQKHIYLKEK